MVHQTAGLTNLSETVSIKTVQGVEQISPALCLLYLSNASSMLLVQFAPFQYVNTWFAHKYKTLISLCKESKRNCSKKRIITRMELVVVCYWRKLNYNENQGKATTCVVVVCYGSKRN